MFALCLCLRLHNTVLTHMLGEREPTPKAPEIQSVVPAKKEQSQADLRLAVPMLCLYIPTGNSPLGPVVNLNAIQHSSAPMLLFPSAFWITLLAAARAFPSTELKFHVP